MAVARCMVSVRDYEILLLGLLLVPDDSCSPGLV